MLWQSVPEYQTSSLWFAAHTIISQSL